LPGESPDTASVKRASGGLVGLVLAAGLALGVVVGSCAPHWSPLELPKSRPAASITPVVFVPGVTGTKLTDSRDGGLVWGATAQLLRPHDGGYQLALPLARGTAAGDAHPQSRYEPSEPLWQMRLPGWTKPIYRPLAEYFAAGGRPLGELEAPEPEAGLFFFDYDWRQRNLDSVRRLDAQLEALRVARGGELAVDLICQSNAGKICRYLVKYGALSPVEAEGGALPSRHYRIRKVIFVGASNNGALRSFQLLLRGRRYIPFAGRKLRPEIVFTIRPLFEDLPGGSEEVFFDERGDALEVDIFDPRSWLEYGWSIFTPAVAERLRRAPRSDLFGTTEDRMAYLEAELEHSRKVQGLLQRDAPGFPDDVRYYLLENRSRPTFDRALLTRVDGRWRTYFASDRRVARDPGLLALAAAPGDGHATLASQRQLSPQELGAQAGATQVEGGHFEMVIAPAGLGALIAFLED